MKLTITAADVAAGVARKSKTCPVYRAIERRMGARFMRERDVDVYETRITSDDADGFRHDAPVGPEVEIDWDPGAECRCPACTPPPGGRGGDGMRAHGFDKRTARAPWRIGRVECWSIQPEGVRTLGVEEGNSHQSVWLCPLGALALHGGDEVEAAVAAEAGAARAERIAAEGDAFIETLAQRGALGAALREPRRG